MLSNHFSLCILVSFQARQARELVRSRQNPHNARPRMLYKTYKTWCLESHMRRPKNKDLSSRQSPCVDAPPLGRLGDRSGPILSSEVSPLLHDLGVELRGLQDADGQEDHAQPLEDVERDAVGCVGHPAAGVPHLGVWVAPLTLLNRASERNLVCKPKHRNTSKAYFMTQTKLPM